MKETTIVKLFPLLVLAFFGCTKDKKANASFEASATTTEEGNAITFTNHSTNANYCLWSFGDGDVSIDDNPSHTYASAGTYTVKLLAVGDDNTSTDSLTITVANVTVIDGVGIKELSLGASWADVKAMYTSLDTVMYTEYDATVLEYYQEVYFYNEGVICIFSTADVSISSNDVVYCIWVRDPYDATTSKGISLGDAMTAVKSAYGTPTIYTGTSYTDYYYPSAGILFYSGNTDVVDAIQVSYASSKKSAIVAKRQMPYLLKKN